MRTAPGRVGSFHLRRQPCRTPAAKLRLLFSGVDIHSGPPQKAAFRMSILYSKRRKGQSLFQQNLPVDACPPPYFRAFRSCGRYPCVRVPNAEKRAARGRLFWSVSASADGLRSELLDSCQTAVFIGGIAGDLAQDVNFRRKRSFIALRKLGAEDGAVGAEGINVELKAAAAG